MLILNYNISIKLRNSTDLRRNLFNQSGTSRKEALMKKGWVCRIFVQ
nr:MAG TPA: hypothetical protein [Caudoviricetes sp.]